MYLAAKIKCITKVGQSTFFQRCIRKNFNFRDFTNDKQIIFLEKQISDEMQIICAQNHVVGYMRVSITATEKKPWLWLFLDSNHIQKSASNNNMSSIEKLIFRNKFSDGNMSKFVLYKINLCIKQLKIKLTQL